MTDWQADYDTLAAADPDLQAIITRHGYPPDWSRPNDFTSLAHIILEQQVSLASALASLYKLRDRLGGITPSGVLQLSDSEMTACYVSRQKASYLRGIGRAIDSGALDLRAFENQSDDQVRAGLLPHKGIGNWTADIYLIMVLGRPDIFPGGDLAALKALRAIKGPVEATYAERWRPRRSAATKLLWHSYLSGHG